LGAGLGGQAAAYGAQAGKSLLEGGMAAATSNLNAARNSPSSLLQSGLSGLGQNQQFQSGLRNFFNPPYVQNTNAFSYGDTTGFSDGMPVTLF
jgi:hypothetical protein